MTIKEAIKVLDQYQKWQFDVDVSVPDSYDMGKAISIALQALKAQVLAKSGRRYTQIPDEYTVDEWDELTPIERLKLRKLL